MNKNIGVNLAILESRELKCRKSDIEHFINLREKTLAIGHQFAQFANVFSRQRFPLYGINKVSYCRYNKIFHHQIYLNWKM